ncbi:MAG: YqgE/AlgH family protein [Crocinitomicaceae bacterium TMED114]|nr:MAG: YqgE/AlgH family protein [Crocinitomicaceae bacterium TMED114]
MEIVPDSKAAPRAGQFLLSEPFLTDPWFGRKTVFLCDHDADGTIGLVLDNGTGRRLKDVLPEAEAWGLDHEVYLGGPIHDDSLFFLHTLGDRVSDAMPVLPGLWLGGDFEGIREAFGQGQVAPGSIRFFVGYSGWSAGQLDAEVERSSWYVHDAGLQEKLDIVLNAEPGDLWRRLLGQKGPEFAKVTGLPVDPSLN